MTKLSSLVFSGIQATGNLHLGNYLGAIKHWVALQKDYPCLYCVVDQHALTVNPNPQDLINSTREVAAAFLATGIDAETHIVFNQARVMQHSELAWIFNCIARIGWMQRMTQFKDKAGKDRENASLGLFAYPSLMAADILLYRATHVPVGDDQKQHIELTRDIAQKFNNDYADRIQSLGYSVDISVLDKGESGFFPLPAPLINATTTRIMSLRDGTKKMSKSDPSDLSRINLIDSADAIAKKIKKAKTDAEPLPESLKGLKKRPEADNLIGIYAALTQSSKQQALNQFSGQQFSNLKSMLTELAVAELAPINTELHRLKADPAYIDSVLQKGGERATILAEKTMRQVRDIVGFLQNA
ncbi:tryptophan--tRNA ligase [Bartonella sp. DGB2]|uniref:tryptophan--tRNA ligase n=1 Tax=Bartonella sp. DGB2 TaxID=3388426 RepID=UPI00398FD07E